MELNIQLSIIICKNSKNFKILKFLNKEDLQISIVNINYINNYFQVNEN